MTRESRVLGVRAIRRWPYPYFVVAWLFVTSVIFMLLNGAGGFLDMAIQLQWGFVPTTFFAQPWVALRAPLALLFNNDGVQYSYVLAIFVLAVPAFELRHGWRRTAFIFVAGGLGSVFAVTILFLWPASVLWPDNAVIVHSITRPYVGTSTAVYACAGAIAATIGSKKRAWAIILGALAWETFVFWDFFHFAELNSVFHYTALFLGFGLAKTKLFEGIPSLAVHEERRDALVIEAEPT